MGSFFKCLKGYLCLRTAVMFAVASALCILTSQARAQDESVTMPLPVESAPHSSADNYLSLDLQQYDYNPEGAQTTDQFSQYTQATTAFGYFHKHIGNDGTESSFESDGLVVLPMSAGTYFEVGVPNAYWSLLSPSKHFQISVGRELQNWSELDDYWHLGIWQPLARWDAADPISQGLTGIFARINEDNYRVTLFASDLFLPDQEPNYQTGDGQIYSYNRWFRSPETQILIGNGESQFNYAIAPVNVNKIIFQRSFAGMVEFGHEKEGPYFKTSYAEKPMNQFHIADHPNVDIGANTVNVTVIPMIVQEHVLTAETGVRFSNDSEFVLSDTWERFDNPDLPNNYYQSQLIDSQYLGLIYRQDLEAMGLYHSNIALSYVDRLEMTNPQTATIIAGQVESSADRLAFARLAGVQFTHQLWQKAKSGLDGVLAFNYSIDDQGVWLHSMLGYKYDPHWTWSLAGDLFGLPSSEFDSTSFVSIYRGNSRLIGGLTYVY